MKTTIKKKKKYKDEVIEIDKISKLYGSVCKSQYTIDSKNEPFAGINEYSQLVIQNDGTNLCGRGIQLWRGTNIADMQGYVKEQDWEDPNNFRIRYWELKKIGGGSLDRFLPISKLKAHGTIKTLEASDKYQNDIGIVKKVAASFDSTGDNFIGVVLE